MIMYILYILSIYLYKMIVKNCKNFGEKNNKTVIKYLEMLEKKQSHGMKNINHVVFNLLPETMTLIGPVSEGNLLIFQH